MGQLPRSVPRRTRRLWVLFAVALFLHGVADPIITMLGVHYVGGFEEANPLLRRGVSQGWGTVIAIQVGIYTVVTALFWLIIRLLQRSDEQSSRRIYRLISLGLVGVIVWGMGLVAWNAYSIWLMSG